MTSLFAEHVNIIPDFLAEISDAIIVDGIVYTGDGMEEDNTMDLRVVLPRDFRDPKLRFDLLITANGVVFDTAMYEVFPSIEDGGGAPFVKGLQVLDMTGEDWGVRGLSWLPSASPRAFCFSLCQDVRTVGPSSFVDLLAIIKPLAAVYLVIDVASLHADTGEALSNPSNNFVSCYKAMECFLLFNAQNPTGHYNLKLHIMSEFAVAQRLLLLDRWECVVNKRNGRLDVSSRANRSHVRNELHGGKQLSLSTFSVAEWSLPEADAFELDYVSSARPPVEAQALTDGLWKQLMVCMYKSDCNPEDKMKVLRSISHSLFITSKHMREMMGYFDKSQQRQEAFVMFFCRIIDMHNLKLCSVRFGEDEEVNNLRYRLGQAVFFPYFQPENAKFELDLGFHDHRLCVNMLVGLAAREKFGNIRDAVWIKPDGSQDDFPMGIPRSWETLSPTEGRFRCRYVCSADDRNFGYRKTIAAKYGYNPRDVREQEMNWLTGLNEPPEDVLDLLEFLISRVDSMQAAFNLIDGGEPGSVSNSELTLRELEQGLKSMGCQKFAGSDESARIEKVFRYLDPGGEGTVSMQEWMVLDQLWKEFDLTIREFVQFLQYAFGENLEDAWEALDDDESGELTEQEFDEALKKKGYFGPVRVVFALLDNTDDGNISFDEHLGLRGRL
ncbi:Zdhhc8 [Symbiodinium natans]|uniref:Zdhhc8 protein n=1 Tax=Symbiodinium natans TaxID=878477 RepID=A0A812UTP9_9DINO|nr:Zdhhc8 [Symbiodinium natans]